MLVVKHGLEQVKKGWKAMIDYKKAEQADKLLLESGVPFMLAYDDTAKHMICRAFGNYPTLKEFIVTMMVQAAAAVVPLHGEGTENTRPIIMQSKAATAAAVNAL